MRTWRPTQPSALTTISDMGNVCFKIRAETLIGGVEIRASFHFARHRAALMLVVEVRLH